MIKIELAAGSQDKHGEIHINKPESVALFLRSGQGNKIQNIQSRTHWFPYLFNISFANNYSSLSNVVAAIPFQSIDRQSALPVPVFIFTGALRL